MLLAVFAIATAFLGFIFTILFTPIFVLSPWFIASIILGSFIAWRDQKIKKTVNKLLLISLIAINVILILIGLAARCAWLGGEYCKYVLPIFWLFSKII